MNRYKNLLNILAVTFVLVFLAWMFGFATPDSTMNWKPKHSMKYETKAPDYKEPMSVKLFGPKPYAE